jgi:hypothetical protein
MGRLLSPLHDAQRESHADAGASRLAAGDRKFSFFSKEMSQPLARIGYTEAFDERGRESDSVIRDLDGNVVAAQHRMDGDTTGLDLV